MKEKILYLVIGILIGAIITAGCFLIFKNNSTSAQGGFDRSGMKMDGNMTGGPGGNMVKPNGEIPADMTSNTINTTNT